MMAAASFLHGLPAYLAPYGRIIRPYLFYIASPDSLYALRPFCLIWRILCAKNTRAGLLPARAFCYAVLYRVISSSSLLISSGRPAGMRSIVNALKLIL